VSFAAMLGEWLRSICEATSQLFRWFQNFFGSQETQIVVVHSEQPPQGNLRVSCCWPPQSEGELKAWWRKMAKQHHPDKGTIYTHVIFQGEGSATLAKVEHATRLFLFSAFL